MKFASILVLAVSALAFLSCNQSTPSGNDSAEKVVLNNIMTRVSIRQYTDQKLDDATLNKILRAGMAAPSAVDLRPWNFIVVDDPAIKKAITDNIGPATAAERAPQVIVVCADMSKTLDGDARNYWVQDCAACIENMLLAAHSMRLGAVYMGAYPQMRRVKFLSELLGTPDHIVPMAMMAVGYPAETVAIKDKYDESLIHTNKW